MLDTDNTSLPNPLADLDLLEDAALQAGAIAVRFFNEGAKSWDKPDSAGPVTEADLAVDKQLRETLCSARPDYGWLSEETPDSAERLAHDTVFIIDPIDGTRSFIEGSTTWALSLAIAHKGQVIAGVIFLPLREKVYAAALGNGATLNGDEISCSTQSVLQGAQVLANKWTLSPKYWPRGVPEVKKSYRPSLAYRMGLVAEGRYDAMMVFRDSWEWDIAAGTLIAQEAGAVVTTSSGAPVVFNNPHPISPGLLAGGPKIHAALIEAQ